VGVDRYSNSPEQVTALPQVGGGIDPNVEAIVALKPDAVLLAKSSRVTQRLEALGVKVLVLEPKNHADVRRVLDKLDQVLGTHDAPKVWRVIDAGVSAAAQSLPASARGLRVYFEVNNAPYAAGESSFIGETLARLGVKNIVPAALGPFPKLNPEYVVRANPDLIMVSVRSAQGLEQRPGWAGIRAVREGRICRFSAEQSDVLVRPGPRMDEAARLMAQCIAEQAQGQAVNAAPGTPPTCAAGAAARRGPAGAGRRADAAGPGHRQHRFREPAVGAARPGGAADRVGHPPAAHAGRLAGRRIAGVGGRGGAGAVPQPAGRPLFAGQRLGRLAGRGGGAADVRRLGRQRAMGDAARPDGCGLHRRGVGGDAHADARARRAADAAPVAGRRDRRRGARRRQGPDHHRLGRHPAGACRASCSAAPAWSAGAPAR
jgi:iron complex transport system substrate-binding protein